MTTIEDVLSSIRSVPRGRAMPAVAYTHPEMLALERERIYGQEWVCVGRQGTLERPGSYLTADVAESPVLVVRQDDGSIRAFVNVCRHRHTQIVDGVGTVSRFVCPYHAWMYDKDGTLVRAKDLDRVQVPADCSQNVERLPEVRCEVWNGFIFVTLADDTQPVSENLAGLAEILQNYHLDRFDDTIVVHDDVDWAANWKLVFENFVDSYHLDYVHRASIGPSTPSALASRRTVREPHFSAQDNRHSAPVNEDVPAVMNPFVPAEDHDLVVVMGVYPNLVFSIEPDFMWWIAMTPVDAARTSTVWGVSFSSEYKDIPDYESNLKLMRELIQAATAEDKATLVAVQKGVRRNDPDVGYLHEEWEAYVGEFLNYIQRVLAGAPQSSQS